MSFTTKYFIDKIQGHQQNSGTVGRHWPSSRCHPCMPCGWSSSWWGIVSFFFFLSPDESFESLWDLWQGDVSHPLQRGNVCEEGRVLEPWESVAGAFGSFLGVALVEPPWLPLPPPPLLGLPSEPVVDFLVMNPMHTFLWLCRVKDDTKACFRHFPHP